MNINEHGINISNIEQNDKLELKISPHNSKTYIARVDSDPTYDLKNNNYFWVEITDTKGHEIVEKIDKERITNFDRIINIINKSKNI